MLVGPVHDPDQLGPVVDVLELDELDRGARDDQSIEAVPRDPSKARRRPRGGRGLWLGGVRGRAQEGDLHLQGGPPSSRRIWASVVWLAGIRFSTRMSVGGCPGSPRGDSSSRDVLRGQGEQRKAFPDLDGQSRNSLWRRGRFYDACRNRGIRRCPIASCGPSSSCRASRPLRTRCIAGTSCRWTPTCARCRSRRPAQPRGRRLLIRLESDSKDVDAVPWRAPCRRLLNDPDLTR